MTQDSVERMMRVSTRLNSLPRRIAFVGGATTGLLVTDPAAAPARSTLDLDLIVEVRDLSDYATSLGPELRRIGAFEDDSEGAPLCRWILDSVVIDIMPTDARILGFANRWYASALDSAGSVQLPDGTRVPVVDAPHFLATKIEAFLGRALHHAERCGAETDAGQVERQHGRHHLVPDVREERGEDDADRTARHPDRQAARRGHRGECES